MLQEEYDSEGVNASLITYSDNRPLLDLLIGVSTVLVIVIHNDVDV